MKKPTSKFISAVLLSTFLSNVPAQAQSGQDALQRMREAQRVVDEIRELQEQDQKKRSEEREKQNRKNIQQQPIIPNESAVISKAIQAPALPKPLSVPTIMAKDYWVNSSGTPVYDDKGSVVGTLNYLSPVTTYGEKDGKGKIDLSVEKWVRLSSLSVSKPINDLSKDQKFDGNMNSRFIKENSEAIGEVTKLDLVTNNTKFDKLKPHLDVRGVVNCHPSYKYVVYKTYGQKAISERTCSSVCEPLKELISDDHYPAMSLILKDYAKAATADEPSMYNGLFVACGFNPSSFPNHQHITRSYKRIPEIKKNKLDVFAASLLVRGAGDISEANKLVKTSADLGHIYAQYTYGKILYDGGDAEGAKEYLEKAASNGSSHAEKSLKELFGSVYTGEKWFVTAEKANVRTSPTSNFEKLLGKYKFGIEVEVYEKRDGWYRVSKSIVAGMEFPEHWIKESELSQTKPKREPIVVYVDDYNDDPLGDGTIPMSMKECRSSVYSAARYRGVGVIKLVDTNTAFMARVPVPSQYSYDFVTCSKPDRKRIVKRISQ